ncbi:hypothetical protein AL073_05175 [Loktanella sp. 1ANDIMAR09]|uniref:Uncharacterized protein n=1 Tax=Yoonia rosea TaxID=287098 RepID=A0A1R3WPK9_9RHOB|nr:hypothetical protein [Yoonia rosea]KQB98272.1 hypothetical protein AL073_05175 [Loktanella sp. 1ANDIMAR09]SIT80079.1 hypothetical protein SAMN05421665_1050 [Yoonia rosea]
MNTPDKTGPDGLVTAAERLAEVDAVSQYIRDRLREMADDLKTVTYGNLNDINKQLDLLHAAHLRVLIAEDKFHDKLGTDSDADAIDYDAIRDEIGRQLDRLRNALIAKGVLGDADG